MHLQDKKVILVEDEFEDLERCSPLYASKKKVQKFTQ